MDGSPRHEAGVADEVDIRTRLEQLRLRQRTFEKYLAAELDVDPAGLAVMDYLMSAGTATPTELARRLDVSTAAMTLVLDRLGAVGHITREPHPTDGRKVLVTPASASIDRAFGEVQPLIDGVDRLVDAMTDDQRAAVSSFLTHVVAVYEAATPH